MTSIYLAGMYSTRRQLVRYAARLEGRGHTITSSWLRDEPRSEPDKAIMDMMEVKAAQVLMLFTNAPGALYSGGGRMVEFGMAAAWNKRLIVVGFHEMIFCHLPTVELYPNFDAALEAL